MRTGTVRVVIATVALWGASAPAHARCAWMGPACSTFWSYEAVFEGTVANIEQKPADLLDPEPLRMPYRIVTFDVNRSWRGDAAGRIQVRSPGGPNVWVEDAFNFKVNRRYLVFARRPPGGTALMTNGCDPTAAIPSKEAAGTLAFLDTLDKPSAGGRISGDVQVVRAGGGREPLEADVILEGPGGERRTARATRGEYSFDGIPPGRYTVTVQTDAGAPAERVEATAIEDPHQCRWVSFYLRR